MPFRDRISGLETLLLGVAGLITGREKDVPEYLVGRSSDAGADLLAHAGLYHNLGRPLDTFNQEEIAKARKNPEDSERLRARRLVHSSGFAGERRLRQRHTFSRQC